MRKKIFLFWYQYNKGHGNFGDELNYYLVHRLSSRPVEYVDIYFFYQSTVLALKVIFNNLFKKRISPFTAIRYSFLNIVKKPRILLAIGSILNDHPYLNVDVWGSGMISRDRKVSRRKFYAVRGKITRDLLIQQGHEVPEVYGDPALLLPLVYIPQSVIKYKVGILPHYTHYEKLKDKYSKDVLVINLLDEIETIVSQINSCEYTLSTSLHGLIVSHAYNIPALWVDFPEISGLQLYGDGMKFDDYFSSVNIERYSPLIVRSENDIFNITAIPNDMALPDSDVIRKIMLNLLKSAPFPLKTQYTNLIMNS